MSAPDRTREFEALLDYLKRSRGFDFTGYKRASLVRRIRKRMQAVGIESYADYTHYLEANADEFGQLFNTVLINVTAFFRDEVPWDFLRDEIVPRLAAQKGGGEPVRAWSAGCASGEEAYTLAIVLAEALGEDALRERVKIYGTDVDEDALSRARHGTYTAREVEGIPQALLNKYFERTDDRYTFRRDLRRSVIFGRNDLMQDAPISRIDLLVCRNTLMYFNAAAQGRILAKFHFAMNDGGFLLLGRAETLFTHANSFTPVDLKRRVFAKVPRVSLRDRLLIMSHGGDEDPTALLGSHLRLRDAAFESGTSAQLVVDRTGALVLANERARALFGLAPNDIGRPLQDLELSYRPADLRSALDSAYSQRRAVQIAQVAWPAPSGEGRWFDVQVLPVSDTAGAVLGASVTFTDTSATKRLQRELEHSHQELEAAYEELQSTNEELETTNEELQSTVEELETTNEELQSTNEELETMNEELQSTNEELQTINDELRLRSEELDQVNAFLESVFSSLQAGVAVVERDMQVLVWTPKAEDMWGLRADEVVGSNFLNLDIGLPVERLRQPIRACLAGDGAPEEMTLAATNRRGRQIACRVVCTPLRDGQPGTVRGVIVMMEEQPPTPLREA